MTLFLTSTQQQTDMRITVAWQFTAFKNQYNTPSPPYPWGIYWQRPLQTRWAVIPQIFQLYPFEQFRRNQQYPHLNLAFLHTSTLPPQFCKQSQSFKNVIYSKLPQLRHLTHPHSMRIGFSININLFMRSLSLQLFLTLLWLILSEQQRKKLASFPPPSSF